MEQFLLEKIECVRIKMLEEASVQRSLTHYKVVALSHELDRYIVLYQKLKKRKRGVIQHRNDLVIAY